MKKMPEGGYRGAPSEAEVKRMRRENEEREKKEPLLKRIHEAIARPDILRSAFRQTGGTYEEEAAGEAEGYTDMELIFQQHLLTLMKTALFIQEVTKNTSAEKASIEAYDQAWMTDDPNYDTAILLLNDLSDKEKDFLRTKWEKVAPPKRT